MSDFDADGLPVTPDYASYYRQLSSWRKQQPTPQRRQPAPALPLFTTRNLRIAEIEGVMRKNYAAYMDSDLPQELARLTGSAAEAKERSR